MIDCTIDSFDSCIVYDVSFCSGLDGHRDVMLTMYQAPVCDVTMVCCGGNNTVVQPVKVNYDKREYACNQFDSAAVLFLSSFQYL